MSTIRLADQGSTAEIKPENGGLVNRFRVNNLSIIYPRHLLQTADGPKIRGGIPILFPNADPLTEPAGEFFLPQHGFARDKKWSVEKTSPRQAVLSLRGDSGTKKLYPFDFELNLRIQISKSRLNYSLTIINPSSSRTLPAAPGLHPYFFIPGTKEKTKLNLPGFDPSGYDWNSILLFPWQAEVLLTRPDGVKVKITASAGFKYFIVWAQPPGPFICIEPWVGKRNALLHTKQRLNIRPKQKARLSMAITVVN